MSSRPTKDRRASYSGGGPRVVATDRSNNSSRRLGSSERFGNSDRRSMGRSLVPGEVPVFDAPDAPFRQVSARMLMDDMSAVSTTSRRSARSPRRTRSPRRSRSLHQHRRRMSTGDEASVATAATLDALQERTRELEGLVRQLSERLVLADHPELSREFDVDSDDEEEEPQYIPRSHMAKAASYRSLLDPTVLSADSITETEELAEFNDPLPPGKAGPPTCIHQVWYSFAFLITFWIPNCLIPRAGAVAKQAWREKVGICVFVVLLSAFFVGFFGIAPLFLCRNRDVWTFEQMWKQEGQAWSVIYGTIYDMKPFIDRHPGGVNGVIDFLGQDASKLFPRIPPAKLPSACLSSKANLTNYDQPTCSKFTGLEELTLHCHTSLVGLEAVHQVFVEQEKGKLVYTNAELEQNGIEWIRIHDRIYDVTDYVESLRDKRTLLIDIESEHAYLNKDLTTMIVNKLKEDATLVYESLFDDYRYLDCMDELFFIGSVDETFDMKCYILQHVMYGLMIFVALTLVLQALCSMLYLARRQRKFKPEDSEAHVMVMVPCYNEGLDVLVKTVHSILESEYVDENKVLTVVTDGIIKGKGESKSTPEYLAELLGFTLDANDHAHEYASLGSKTINYASVYFGTYLKNFDGKVRSLKYIVVVKRGTEEEATSARAGNRGKRDSQIILQGMFNRFHNCREPCPLDLALGQALAHLGFSAKSMEYLMTIDADTRVAPDAMQHMVSSMEEDKNILACCGETQVENKTASWVTMIQVFEYYSSHHLKKAFESVFGCVTCLPGCFTMYRLQTNECRSLWAADDVIQRYSRNDIESLHDRNLYDLGEDRMLTTILLQNFPGMKLSFVPEATCWTVVPHTYAVLMSQRRRWINSTFHNLLELLKVQTMCGMFCFSMKLVVILDLISTMVLPASLIQAGYFIYASITNPQEADKLVLALYGVIIAVQMCTFILRSRPDHFFWYFIFMVLGMPIFYFILPLYSFWNMDDFSWGATRQVAAAPNQMAMKDDFFGENSSGTDQKPIDVKEVSHPVAPAPRKAQKAKKESYPDADIEAAVSRGGRASRRSSDPVDLDAVECGRTSKSSAHYDAGTIVSRKSAATPSSRYMFDVTDISEC